MADEKVRNTEPDTPTQLTRASWWEVARRSVRQVGEDKLTTWAAALTYYAILSMFPGMLVLISALRLAGPGTTQRVLNNVTSMAPGTARQVLTNAIQNLQHGASATAGILAVVGVLGALWSASGYISSFMQRARAVAAGHDPNDEPYLELRDTRKLDPEADTGL